MSDKQHTWPDTPEEPPPPTSWASHVAEGATKGQRFASRCSICGVRRHSQDPVQIERAAGPCPGPGANGVKFRERTTS